MTAGCLTLSASTLSRSALSSTESLATWTSTRLKGLSTAEKSPFVVRLLGANDASARGAASMFELGSTITGWPQLASEVTLGAVTVAAAVRRFALGGELPSGRVRFDVEEIISELAPVDVDTEANDHLVHPIPEDPPTKATIQSTSSSMRHVGLPRVATRNRGASRPITMRSASIVVPERSTSSMDVRLRGSYVALGAALFNARVAAASIKKLGSVELFPEGINSEHVATLQLGTQVDASIARLRSSVLTRAANRRFGRPAPIDDATIAQFARSVEREGARLRLSTDRDQIEAQAKLLAAVRSTAVSDSRDPRGDARRTSLARTRRARRGYGRAYSGNGPRHPEVRWGC